MPELANPPVIFALDGSGQFGAQIAAALGQSLAAHEERDFEDGEHKARPLASVRGCHVYVVHSLYGEASRSANDKLCRLLFFCGAVRDAGARTVTAVTPYLCYARKDRKTKPYDPVTTRYIAQLTEAMGIDRLVTIEVHNLAAFQNAFRCATEHLDARHPLAQALLPELSDGPITVVSPDAGGTKRAEAFRQVLEVRLGQDIGSAFMEKYRSGGHVSGESLIGEFDGCTAVILDDLIASGGTMLRAARKARAQGAARVIAVATHGLFVQKATEAIADPAFDAVFVTDTVPPFRLEDPVARSKVTVVPVGALVGEAIRRIETGGSLVSLVEEGV